LPITFALFSGIAVFLPARPAHADVSLRLGLAGSHAVGDPQAREFGFGGTLHGGAQLLFWRRLGLYAGATATVLAKGEEPLDPRLAPKGIGTAGVLDLGVRVYPFARGLYVGGGFGPMITGSEARLNLHATAGWDFNVTPKITLGPQLLYSQTYQGEGALRPEDARVLSLGATLGYDLAPDPKLKKGDTDGDGVLDVEDACPERPGIRTNDPQTNGCPSDQGLDRDHDGIPDASDACPFVKGVPNDDPKLNGCPPDKDRDGILDPVDACPDEPGVTSTDPKMNGCPRRDRDHDKVFDDEDACPDVAGIRTADMKTNGCPPPEDNIRVEGELLVMDDVILFDRASPKVREISWFITEKVANYLKKRADILEISIEGHADATGSEEFNLVLSRQRAEAVRALLIKYGIAPERVRAEAFGRSRLKVQTTQSERKNRRVEFWITATKSTKEAKEGGAQ
jgi:OmpA-OmpF porin, OOP family